MDDQKRVLKPCPLEWIRLLRYGIVEYKLGNLFMDEMRTKCEIITSTISDTE